MTPPTAPPDAQVGIAFTRDGEISSFAEGLADPAAGRAVTPDDPVRIASISKLVVAIGVMKLVEAGAVDLDADVSVYLGWTPTNPAYPDHKVSLRHLLSHTSSVRDHDDQYAVPLGETVEAAMVARTSWDTSNPPGRRFHYSNMNFPIVAEIIEHMTSERFDIWMRREVLDPMKIDACFNWPTCSDAAVARAVVLRQDGKVVRDDLQGKRPDCPVFVRDGEACDLSRWKLGDNGSLFSPQGGLRISARGLARVGRLLLGGGTLDGVRILSPQSVDTLLTQVWRFDGRNGDTEDGFYCSYGLATRQIPTSGAGCADNPGTRGATFVGHAGDAYGVRSGLWIDRAAGHGIAYFVTGLPADPPRGRGTAFRAAEQDAFRRTLGLIRP
ncbi:beta-lactamase family protein [Sphingomonas lutea]|uniref:Beta-lactamase family protein n=2 Tax=Sphingomonas lutea TaxID=1045317 RepID=A0A7G9SLF4_9SPHN|nr:beta-lactamase family protein [Sphingomonas lutea]